MSSQRHPLLCTRAAWLAWRDAAELRHGPALRAVRGTRPGPRALSPDAVTRLIIRAGARAGLPYRVTGHGLHASFATAAYRAGWDLLTIARHGRWADNSAELLGYIREVSRWQHNPTDRLDIDPELEP